MPTDLRSSTACGPVIDAALLILAGLALLIGLPFYVAGRILVGLDNLRNGVSFNHGFHARCDDAR